MAIADLPFVERPVLELLHFEDDRLEVDRDYAGYGWARMPRVWLETGGTFDRVPVDDALVIALHSCDVGEVMKNDIELEFELPGAPSVTVLASKFLEIWLPKLPRASAVVLAMCNPHAAVLRTPPGATAPIHYSWGDVESWQAENGDIELLSDIAWHTLPPATGGSVPGP